MTTTTRALALSLLLLLAGCGGAEPKPEEPRATPLGRYDDLGKARVDLEIMLQKLGADATEVTALQHELDELMKRPDVAKEIQDQGLSAVAASADAGGAAVLRLGGGTARVCFAGGRHWVPIDLSGWSGPTGEGEKTYAVGVVCGLKQEADLPGSYDVVVEGAGGEGSSIGTARPRTGSHVIHFAGKSVGFAGGHSSGEVTISWAAPKAP